jgi:hypothetical protein
MATDWAAFPFGYSSSSEGGAAAFAFLVLPFPGDPFFGFAFFAGAVAMGAAPVAAPDAFPGASLGSETSGTGWASPLEGADVADG